MLNDWVRGTCRLGMVPANGMLYSTPNACHCYAGTKLMGFNALIGGQEEQDLVPDPEEMRLVCKSPANGDKEATNDRGTKGEWVLGDFDGAWPTYRHDARRSGTASTSVPAELSSRWATSFHAPLSPPVAALGKVFAVTPETYELRALDADSGKRVWSFTGGGRIDSPPTILVRRGDRESSSGLCIFGCTDGWVYAVRAADGELVWKFRAAPKVRLVGSDGRLESAWPVHGSVLVQGGVVYAAAGRSSFLDGGIWYYGLDPGSGRVLYRERLYDSETTAEAFDGRGGHDATQGALNDILVGGSKVYMGRQPVGIVSGSSADSDAGAGSGQAGQSRLLATSGFLDDSMFNRSWWLYGTWPGYNRKPVKGAAGQLLVFNESATYGVRVFRQVTRLGGRSPDFKPGEGYELFAVPHGGGKKPPKDRWSENVPVRVSSMVLAGPTLFVAGSPDRLDEGDPLRSIEGRGEGVLMSMAATDGTKQRELTLDSPPVFDGLIAAGGRLYLSTADGKLICLAGETSTVAEGL